jgi:ribosomal protein L16 Arg81 hydroxylase
MAISSKNNQTQVDPEYEITEDMADQLRESIDRAIMERIKNMFKNQV